MNLPIAEQYGLRLSRDYKVKSSCVQHTGDVNDANKRQCWSVASDCQDPLRRFSWVLGVFKPLEAKKLIVSIHYRQDQSWHEV